MSWVKGIKRLGHGLNTLFFAYLLLFSLPYSCSFCSFRCFSPSKAQWIITSFLTFGIFTNTCLLVFLLHFFGIYDKIQSLEVSYVVWHLFISFFIFCESYIESHYGEDKRIEWEQSLFRLFQINITDYQLNEFDTSGVVFHYFFVSLVPAIAAGYTANWFLEDRYELTCNDTITTTESVVLCGDEYDNNTCCKLSYLNTNVYEFVVIALASMYGGYKIVAAIVCTLFKYYRYDESNHNNNAKNTATANINTNVTPYINMVPAGVNNASS